MVSRHFYFTYFVQVLFLWVTCTTNVDHNTQHYLTLTAYTPKYHGAQSYLLWGGCTNLLLPIRRSDVTPVGSSQYPQLDEWGGPRGTLQISFFIPPHWCNGALFGPQFHGFLWNKKHFSRYLVALGSPGWRQLVITYSSNSFFS